MARRPARPGAGRGLSARSGSGSACRRDRTGPRETRAGVAVAGTTLGVGLGGFIDGTLFHQILQWHHFTSSVWGPDTLEGLRAHTLSDGLFHAATYAVVLAGVALLWRLARTGPVRERGLDLAGWMLVGWGAFNAFDVVVFHFALGLHRLREGPDALAYDLGWLGVAVLLVAGGLSLAGRR